MREMDDKQNRYRYHLPNTQQSKKAPSAEAEVDRYYELIRHKLSPERLKRAAIVNISVLLGILFLFFFASLLLEKPQESHLEKRALAKMPDFTAESLFRGTLTRDIETFFSDTFPLREGFVGLSAVLEENRGVRVDDVRIIVPSNTGGDAGDASVSEAPSPNQGNPSAQDMQSDVLSQKDAPAQSQPQAAAPDAAAQGDPGIISNGTFVHNGRAMSLFGGSKQSAARYAQVLNTYRQELPDVQIYNMLIPTAIEFYVPDKYRDLSQSQREMIDNIYQQLDGAIKRVDAYSQLEAHREEYLYFRTDHHWTGLGAYYAYTAFCEQAGLTPIRLEDCETRRLEQFVGTMYAQSKDSTLLKNPDYVDYYIFPQEYSAVRYMPNAPYSAAAHTLWGEYAQSPNSYSVFLHGDFPLIKVNTTNQNGRKIMVVKESFGNAFAPFLINHYEEVYIVDQRYFQLSLISFIQQNQIDELLFANNTFAACTPYHIGRIDSMRHQSFVPYLPPQTEEQKNSSEQDEQKVVEKEEAQEESAQSGHPKKKVAKKTSNQDEIVIIKNED